MPDTSPERWTATRKAVAVTAAQDFWELLCPAGKRLELVGIEIGQYSDFGDAQAEILSVVVTRGYAVTGSGGTVPTPKAPRSSSAPASGATVKANNTTPASGGTPEDLLSTTWNVSAGLWQYPEEKGKIILQAGERLAVTISAPADSLTCNGTLTYDEYNVVA